MVLVKVERVDENLIEEIVKRILSVVNPMKIIPVSYTHLTLPTNREV